MGHLIISIDLGQNQLIKAPMQLYSADRSADRPRRASVDIISLCSMGPLTPQLARPSLLTGVSSGTREIGSMQDLLWPGCRR